MEPQKEKKKRNFSDRQLNTVLDGGYWSVNSSSRPLKRSSEALSSLPKPVRPEKPVEYAEPEKPAPPPEQLTQDTLAHDYILPPTNDFYTTPSDNNIFSVPISPSTIKMEPNTLTPSPIKMVSTTSNNENILPPPVDHNPLFQPSEEMVDVVGTNDVQPHEDKKEYKKEEKNEDIYKKEDTTESKKGLQIYQDPQLDGSYWATFDPNQRRKKERVLSDISMTDDDYWNKRNTRVVQRKPPPPAPPISDELIAKRKERLQQIKDENRKREQDEHDRLSRKQEEARVGKQIFTGVYLGGRHAAKNKDFFVDHNIKSVINVTTDIPNYHENDGIIYKKICIADLPTVNLLDLFDDVTNSISELLQHGNVLVHCREGRSRSVSMTIAYGMKKLNLSLADSHAALVDKAEVQVNIGFQQQLMSYERLLFNAEINTFNFLKKRNGNGDRDRMMTSR